jgi:hypothetical protein
LSLSTGTADLKINGEDSLANALTVTNAYPGWQDAAYFELTNNSSTPIQLDTTAKLVSATGHWGELKDVVSVAVVEYANSTDATNAKSAGNPGLGATANTGWKTLSDWNSADTSFGNTLANPGTHSYLIWATVPSSADNSVSGKAVSVDYVITGTQH